MQSAQRSKARKLRQILHLEEEVHSLQAASLRQLKAIDSLRSEIRVLSAPFQILPSRPVRIIQAHLVQVGPAPTEVDMLCKQAAGVIGQQATGIEKVFNA